MFPGGLAGAALCAMRFSVAAMFLVDGSGRWALVTSLWASLLFAVLSVLLCVGGGGAPAPETLAKEPTVRDFDTQPSRRMHVSDALALASLTGVLQGHHKAYRFLNRASATSFRDLQSGPFILIGGLNNGWTRRLTGTLRFRLESGPDGARVVDAQKPSGSEWKVVFDGPLAQLNRDYAIVSRLRDRSTEQVAVIVAGIGSWGTLAAGEFVSNPEHLKKLDQFVHSSWWDKNLQAVIATDVIQGSSGPPNVLAVHVW